MIYQEVTESQFRDAFHNMGRADSWSYQGLGALYAYLVERSNDLGNGYDRLDVIAIDCEFSEYACIDEFHESYDSEDHPDIETIPNSSSFIISEF